MSFIKAICAMFTPQIDYFQEKLKKCHLLEPLFTLIYSCSLLKYLRNASKRRIHLTSFCYNINVKPKLLIRGNAG